MACELESNFTSNVDVVADDVAFPPRTPADHHDVEKTPGAYDAQHAHATSDGDADGDAVGSIQTLAFATAAASVIIHASQRADRDGD